LLGLGVQTLMILSLGKPSKETLRIVIVNQKLHEFVILLLFSVFLNWKALL
jgi:hypothetical protein